jgi:hypothetical protein
MNFGKQRAEALGKVQATVREAAQPVMIVAVAALLVAAAALAIALMKR